MQYRATSAEDYIRQTPEERHQVLQQFRYVITTNLPQGFEAGIPYGMTGYYGPHSISPSRYHCHPEASLPFISFASHKNSTKLYHSGINAVKDIHNWFAAEYLKHSSQTLDIKTHATGIGGLFFKSKDPKASKEWYKTHLGFNAGDYGCTFWWKDQDGKDWSTLWHPFKDDTTYIKPSHKDFIFNYRVANLETYLDVVKEEGVTIVGDMETYSYGTFTWTLDNEGRKIELQEPIHRSF